MASMKSMQLYVAYILLGASVCAAGTGKRAMIQTDNMVPAWACPENYLRDAPASDAVHIQLDLGFRNHDEVQTFSAAVSDPSSPLYRRYLSPDDFNSKFAPTARQAARVAKWLHRQGLVVVHIPSNNKYVAAEGDVAAMNRVFATKLALYNGPRGLILRAPSIAPSLPKFIIDSATRVAIHGLDQHTHALKPSVAKRWATDDSTDLQSNRRQLLTKTPTPHPNGCIWNSTTTSVPPLLNSPGQTRPEGCHYTTNQFREAYSVPSHLTGKGQTICLLLWNYTPFLQRNLDVASALSGIKSTTIEQIFPPFNYTRSTVLHNPIPSGFYDSGLAPEEYIDTQIAHGMAPDAKLIFVNALSPFDPDLLSALNFVVSQGLANFVSNSWGSLLYGPYGYLNRTNPSLGASAILSSYEDIFMQAAATGIGMYFSSGDSGDSSTYPYSGFTSTPQWPAASPMVTAVGATALAIGLGNTYLFEYPWGWNICLTGSPAIPSVCSSLAAGGGGGFANYGTTPPYQAKRKDVRAVIRATGMGLGRVVPDISMTGDPNTGFVIVDTEYVNEAYGVQSYEFVQQGGTSLSSPMLVGLLACAAEEATSKKQPPFGFITPTLYAMKASSFNDITQKNISLETPLPPELAKLGFSNRTFVFGYNVGLTTLKGYDNSTGIGSPGPTFIADLVQFYKSK